MTASKAWPNVHSKEWKERSTNRWQHRLQRERPTCTERKDRSLRVRMEGWRQWRLGREKKLSQRKGERTDLTPTGLLMEGFRVTFDSAPDMVQLRKLTRRGFLAKYL